MDYKDLYTDGEVDCRVLYGKLFDKLCDEYAWKFPEDMCVDWEHIDPSSAKDVVYSVMDKCEVYCTLARAIKRSSSCASKSDTPAYKYDGAFMHHGYVCSHLTIVDKEWEMIITIGSDSIDVLYDADAISFNAVKNIVDSIYSKLPVMDNSKVDPSSVYLINYANGGFFTSDAEICPTVVDVDSNYNDDFKDEYEKLVNFLDKGFRHSGIAILHGEPGSGKSWLIKHLMTNIPNKYVYMGTAEASKMGSPDFKTFLMEHQNCVFIIEDCEALLQDRGISALGGTLSTVLNMSDGILSDIFNAKFICTYNGTSPIDDALLRPGRCFVNYKFDKLSEDKAKALLEKLGKSTDCVDGPISLAEIYNGIDGDKPSTSKKRKIGY